MIVLLVSELESEPYRPLLAAYIAGTQEAFATVGQTGDDVAAVIVQAATAELPHLRYVTSDVVRGLEHRRPLVITLNGKPAAVMMSPSEYDRISYRDPAVRDLESLAWSLYATRKQERRPVGGKRRILPRD